MSSAATPKRNKNSQQQQAPQTPSAAASTPTANGVMARSPGNVPLASPAGLSIFKQLLQQQQGPARPAEGRSPRQEVAKELTWKQYTYLASFGFCTLEQLHKRMTNTEFNSRLKEGREHASRFCSEHGGAPGASTTLHALANHVHDGELPPLGECTKKMAMEVWIAGCGGIHADIAAELIWDFGLPMDDVVALSQDQGRTTLEGMAAARASNKIPAVKRSHDNDEDGADAPAGQAPRI